MQSKVVPLQFLEQIIEALGNLAGMELSTSSGGPDPGKVAAVVVLGIGVTIVAGVAVAAAIGGFFLLSDGRSLNVPWEPKVKRPKPLSPDQWRRAFEPDDGRLKGGGEKVIGRVRRGGVDPNIRGEVWPFLFGLYSANSTRAERAKQRAERRRRFAELREEVRHMAGKARAAEAQREALEREEEERARRKTAASAAPSGEDSCREEEEAQRHPFQGEGSEAEDPLVAEKPVVDGEEGGGCGTAPGRANGGEPGGAVAAAEGGSRTPAGAPPGEEVDSKAEDFATWQRIMRLDAVRMNAAWIPYSSQAEVSEEEAAARAQDVGLSDDGHLEAPRRLHAARLVTILEAYALHDPGIGYCQGMSDLLSPFVALIDDDADAFWCYESFMRKARHNFRTDEVGIRKQLEAVARIVRAADPELYAHLASIQAEDCIFVYRMIVVLLRRELSFEQTLCLWEVAAAAAAAAGGEVLGGGERGSAATGDLVLYVVAAILCSRRKSVLECEGMDEVLRLCNSVVGQLDLWALLQRARTLVDLVEGSPDHAHL